MGPRGKRRPTTWGSAFGAVAIVVAVLVPAPAALADCAPLDVTCIVNGGNGGSGGSPVGGILKTGGGILKTGGGIVKKITDTGGSLVNAVGGTVDKVLHPGRGNGGENGGGSGSGGGAGHGGASSGRHRALVHAGGLGSPRVRALLTATAQRAGGTQPIPAATRPASGSFFSHIGRVAAAAAVTLGFPILLALIVLAFLMLQGRIDRRDPKLALAPVKPDVVRFE